MNDRKVTVLGTAVTILLGLIAIALSVAAVVQYRGEPTGEPLPAVPASVPGPTTGAPSPGPSASPAASGSASGSASASASPGGSASPGAATVVVIGDAASVGDPAATWIGPTADALGWGEVVNLSAAGRGYLKQPRSCAVERCENEFALSIPEVKRLSPQVVVTFGGAVDGGYNIRDAAGSYYRALRAAAPNATIVALSPVTGQDTAPFWLTLHGRAISAEATAAGGTMVDLGQPGLGDGGTLSPDAQREISRLVVEKLRRP